MSESGQGITPETLAKLRQVSSATVTHDLMRMGYRNTYMHCVRPLQPGYRAFGRAVTLRYLPFREDVGNREQTPEGRESNNQRRAIESVENGDILVIDARGDTRAGVLGDVLTARLRYRGAAGVVTDGAVRDSAAIREMGFPVFCAGAHGAVSPSIHWAPDFNTPIQCGGVLVLPGDYILADDDGVVVIPAVAAAEVAERAWEHERQDAFSRQKVEAGEPISRAYPLGPELLQEYKRHHGLA